MAGDKAMPTTSCGYSQMWPCLILHQEKKETPHGRVYVQGFVIA